MMVVGYARFSCRTSQCSLGCATIRLQFKTNPASNSSWRSPLSSRERLYDVTEIYKQDRLRLPDIRMYLLQPGERFALAEIFSPPASSEPRRSFQAQVFQGHLERGGEVLRGLSGITVRIKRVVYAHEFRREDKRVENLEYILFGTPDEAIPGTPHTRAG